MQLRKKNMVKLLPSWPEPSNANTPIWGGPRGFIGGVVVKTLTHDPDHKKHLVIVHWSNGQTSGIHEDYLQELSEEEKNVAHDFAANLPFIRDIWALVRDTANKYWLHIVEPNTYIGDRSTNPHTVTITAAPLTSVEKPNFTIINELLQTPGSKEIHRSTLYSSLMEVYRAADCEFPATIPLPVPEYDTIEQAVKAIPDKEGPGISFFHLPRNMAEYACSGA